MRGGITTVAVSGLLVLASSARAEPGLTVDPQSPAGVEYAVPLDQGRHHGGPGSQGGGSGAPELFGKGITPQAGAGAVAQGSGGASGGTSGQGGGGRQPGSKKTAGGGGGRVGPGGVGPGGVVSSASVPPVRAAADFSSSSAIAGLIAAILCVGVGLGLFLRVRARRSSHDHLSS